MEATTEKKVRNGKGSSTPTDARVLVQAQSEKLGNVQKLTDYIRRNTRQLEADKLAKVVEKLEKLVDEVKAML